MAKLSLSRPKQKSQAQALVEFSLTILVFLLLLVMIIEVARIMQAYVTLQSAARAGARYAVTGQFLPQYGLDPMAGWDITGTSADALDHIPPCWPRFSDDAVAPTPAAKAYYEPYRNERTCSVEEMAIRGMVGLGLDPLATPSEAGYYQVVVRGVGPAVTPDNEFIRYLTDSSHALYGTYPADVVNSADLTALGYDYSQAGTYQLIPGYAGQPMQKVVVQVEYRLAIITPLLSSITPSVRLTGTATMTNEPFGSTGVLREAILPPELPPIPTLGAPTPPDLIISQMTPVSFPPTVEPDTLLTFNIRVSNNGSLDARHTSDIPIRVWVSTTPLSAGEMVSMSRADSAPPGTELTPVSNTIPFVLAGSYYDTQIVMRVPASLPGGTYYFYAWVDPAVGGSWVSGAFQGDLINEEGDPADFAYAPAREENNVYSPPITINVGEVVDLEILPQPTGLVASNATPNESNPVDFTIKVRNNGPSTAQGVVLRLEDTGGNLLVGFDLTATPGCSEVGTAIECNLGSMTNGELRTVVIPTTVNTGTSGTEYNVFASVSHTGAHTESAPANNTSYTVPVKINASDLSIDLIPSTNDPTLNETFTYQVVVTNSSPNQGNAVVVRVSNNPTAVITYQAAPAPTLSQGTIGSLANDEIIWNVGDVPGNSSATMTFTARVTGIAGNVLSTAQITSTHFDLDTTDFTDVETITVQTVDLSINSVFTAPVSGNSVTVSEGQRVAYQVTVASSPASDITANNVVVTDVLPPGLTYDAGSASVTAGSVTYNSGTRTLTWSGFNLAVGGNATLTYTATVNAGVVGTHGNGPFYNNVSVTSAAVDDTPANNSDTNNQVNYIDLIDLALENWIVPMSTAPTTGTVSMSGVVSDQQIDYVLRVTNVGPTPANGVYVDLDAADLSTWFTYLTYVNATATHYTGSNLAADLLTNYRWDVGTLNAGESATLTISLVVNSREGLVPNARWITLGGGLTSIAKLPGYPDIDVNPADNSATITTLDIGGREFYVNPGGGGNNCQSPINWGTFNAGSPNYRYGHPLIGRNVTWLVWSNANRTWTSSGSPTFYDNQASNIAYPDGDANSGNNPTFPNGTPERNLWRYCRVDGTNFTLSFLDLVPGQWRVTFLVADWTSTSTARGWGIQVGGSWILGPNYDVRTHVNDTNPGANPTNTYVIEQRTVRVDSTNRVSFNFIAQTNRALLQGIGVEYVGP